MVLAKPILPISIILAPIRLGLNSIAVLFTRFPLAIVSFIIYKILDAVM